jgi:hypothetical protein
MKRTSFPIALLMIFCFGATEVFSQFNPLTNSYTGMTADIPVTAPQTENQISYSSLSGVSCIANSFWAIASTTVDQFTLEGDVITKVGTTVIAGAFDPNLAFCNNLNGGTFSPTFYSTINYNQPVYLDSTVVTSTSSIWPDKLINCGGSGKYLYYLSYDNTYKAKAIVRFNGSTISTVFNLRNDVTATVADLAIDSTGNVWFFTGLNNGEVQTDTLNVISPAGQLLKQYPFPYNTYSAYGSFLLNRKIYVGLGSDNTSHRNTILPITITATSATAGTPIPMPVTTVYSDLASCSAGSPFSINEHNVLTGITVYPNPMADKLTINSNTGQDLEISLYDINAVEIYHKSFTNSVTLNTEQLPRGIYLYKIKNKTGEERSGKVVKE